MPVSVGEISDVRDCKTWWGGLTGECAKQSHNCVSLKHIMALSTMLSRVLMKCHRLRQSIISSVLLSEPHQAASREGSAGKGHRSFLFYFVF